MKPNPNIKCSDAGHRVYRNNGRYSAHAPDTEYRGAQICIGTFASFEDAAKACEEDSKR